MKKVLVLLLAMMMCVAVFAGCGGGDKAPAETAGSPAASDSEANEGAADVSGEVFDAGNVSVVVPSGWKAFAVADVFAEEDDATDPNAIQIGKGAESEWDLFTKPYIQINYYGPETTMMEPDKEWYDGATDLEPIKAGDYTWKGFSGSSFDMPIVMLWTSDGDHQFQASMWVEMENGKISVEDADVQAILASVKVSK